MKKQTTIFMTGATGFVGSNLAYEFLNHGYSLKLLVRGENAEQKIDSLFYKLYYKPEEYSKFKKRVEIIKGDITKENLGISVQDIERLSQEIGSVFHCAASVSFDESEKEEIEKQNVGGTKNLLEFMCRLKLHELHYMSTAYVAGQRIGIVYEDELDKGQSFNNTYEESKFKAERLVKSYGERYNIETTIYRPAIIVGDSKTGRTSSFWGFYSLVKSLYTLIRIFKEDLKRNGRRSNSSGVYYKDKVLYMPLRVRGIPDKTLNLVPIDYVVNVVMRIFKDKNTHSKIYHVTNPNPATLEYIQRLVCDCLDVSGVKIAEPLDFQTKPINQWEEFFSECIQNFAPYLQKEEPTFSNKNTQEVLNGTNIRCPHITKNLISKLISYCIDTDWGKKINESLLHTAINY